MVVIRISALRSFVFNGCLTPQLRKFTMASHKSDPFVTFPQANEFSEAMSRIETFIHRTPVITSRQANERSGRKLYFKAENLQKSGSFKVRGAINAILKAIKLKPDLQGVVTHSSGNHGQAVAWACQETNIPSYVVVPQSTPQSKKSAITGYGGHLVECGPLPTDRYETCEKLRLEKDYEFIPPYDHRDVIAGQGTIALELLAEVPNLDAILIPISGGGLSSGIAAAAKSIKPEIKVFLVSPKGKMMEECLRSGERPWTGPPQYLDTIADGIKLQQTGQLTTPALIQLAEKDVFDMSEEEIIQGMKFSFERMKLVIEAAAGASVAAALSDRLKSLDSSMKHIGVILCGGNLDIEKLPWMSK